MYTLKLPVKATPVATSALVITILVFPFVGAFQLPLIFTVCVAVPLNCTLNTLAILVPVHCHVADFVTLFFTSNVAMPEAEPPTAFKVPPVWVNMPLIVSKVVLAPFCNSILPFVCV